MLSFTRLIAHGPGGGPVLRRSRWYSLTAPVFWRRFPLDDLDLTPFLSSSVLRSRYGLRDGTRPADSDGLGSGELDGDDVNGELSGMRV